MRSYPNFIPLSAKLVQGIGAALEPFQFDRIYGHHFDKVIDRQAKQVLRQSVQGYVDAVSGKYEND
jgi:hypothetical protein